MKNLCIFDCFGVVVTDVSSLWMNRHFDNDEKQYILKNFFRKVDTAQITQEQMYRLMAERYHVSAREIWEEWEQLIGVKEETLQLIDRLRARGDSVVLLSNASVEYIDYLFEKFGLFGYFDKVFVSAHYGTAKPDEEFYRICLDSFNEKFDKIFFTDDNPANLVNLEKFGITPVLFTTASEVEKQLK